MYLIDSNIFLEILLEQKKRKSCDEIVSNINVVHLELDSLKEIDDVKSKFNLDFDDAYQYLSAKKLNLQIVSFDKDFDKTDAQRIEP